MPVNTTSGNARRSHRAVIDCPANAISAPHFSAKSAQRGFMDSIRTIFFARRQPFSCFSRLIALRTSSKRPSTPGDCICNRWKSPRSRHSYAARRGRTDCWSFRWRERRCGWQRCTPNTSCGPPRFNLLPSKLCHLEQSKDPHPVISANGASWSSPCDVDASDRIERTPCRVHRSSRG